MGGSRVYEPPTRTNYRLIVDNVTSHISWQDLKYHMCQIGDVTFADAHIQDHNKGIVEFASYFDMRNAIDKLDEIELNGTRIRLTEDINTKSRRLGSYRSRSRSRNRSPRRSGSHSLSRSSQSKRKIRAISRSGGANEDRERYRANKPKSMFRSRSNSRKSNECSRPICQKIRIERSDWRPRNRIIVENVSSWISWQNLKGYMHQVGEITFTDKQHLNERIVEFASHSDMRNAIEKLDEIELNGRRIRLVEDRNFKRSRSGSHSSRSSRRSRSRSLSRRRSYSNSLGSRTRSRSGSAKANDYANKSKFRSRSRSIECSRPICKKMRIERSGWRSRSRKPEKRSKTCEASKVISRSKFCVSPTPEKRSMTGEASKMRPRSRFCVSPTPGRKSKTHEASKDRSRSRFCRQRQKKFQM